MNAQFGIRADENQQVMSGADKILQETVQGQSIQTTQNLTMQYIQTPQFSVLQHLGFQQQQQPVLQPSPQLPNQMLGPETRTTFNRSGDSSPRTQPNQPPSTQSNQFHNFLGSIGVEAAGDLRNLGQKTGGEMRKSQENLAGSGGNFGQSSGFDGSTQNIYGMGKGVEQVSGQGLGIRSTQVTNAQPNTDIRSENQLQFSLSGVPDQNVPRSKLQPNFPVDNKANSFDQAKQELAFSFMPQQQNQPTAPVVPKASTPPSRSTSMVETLDPWTAMVQLFGLDIAKIQYQSLMTMDPSRQIIFIDELNKIYKMTMANQRDQQAIANIVVPQPQQSKGSPGVVGNMVSAAVQKASETGKKITSGARGMLKNIVRGGNSKQAQVNEEEEPTNFDDEDPQLDPDEEYEEVEEGQEEEQTVQADKPIEQTQDESRNVQGLSSPAINSRQPQQQSLQEQNSYYPAQQQQNPYAPQPDREDKRSDDAVRPGYAVGDQEVKGFLPINKNDKFARICDVVPMHMLTDREPEIIRICNQRGIKFTDPEFKPCFESLVDPESQKRGNYNADWRNYKWGRASEVYGGNNFKIWNEIEPTDLMQGELGTCFMLSALSSLAETPGLLERLFDVQTINNECVYAVWLNINGVWKEIILDDYFPLIESEQGVQFAFSRSHDDEIWVNLLEKAYAKAYGSYFKIDGGVPFEALRDLTGAPIDVYAEDDLKNVNYLWERIFEADNKGFIICVSTPSTEVREEQRSDGLISGHAYSLIAAKEVMDRSGQRSRIVQIRNPWGSHEWTGDWSDQSPKWTDELKRQLHVTAGNDGIFWMSIEDFCRTYEDVAICKVHGNYYYNSIQLEGKKEEMVTTELVVVNIQKPGHYYFSVDQWDGRQFPEGHTDANSRIMVARVTSNPDSLEWMGCAFDGRRNCHVSMQDLPAGKYIVVADLYWTQDYHRKFTVSTYGVALAGIAKPMLSGLAINTAQYYSWRNFANMKTLPKYKGRQMEGFKNPQILKMGDGLNKVEVTKSEADYSKEFGVEIKRYEISKGKASFTAGFLANGVKGYEIISEINEGESHLISCSPGQCEIELLKQEPNVEGGNLEFNIEPVEAQILPRPMPEDLSVVGKLLSTNVPIPTCQTPPAVNPFTVQKSAQISQRNSNTAQQYPQQSAYSHYTGNIDGSNYPGVRPERFSGIYGR